jgi:YYY domain-containing protein
MACLKCDSYAFAMVIIIAAAFRFYGIDWDNGYLFHPDERAILFHVIDMEIPPLKDLAVIFDPVESPLNPQWFPYGTLPLYAVKICQWIIEFFITLDFYDLRFVGRVISSFADIGTIFFVFLLAKKLFSRKVGILASLFVSLSVIHIQLSHFYAVDTYLTFFITGSLYFMARVMREGGSRNSMLAGAFIGLGLASKVSILPIYLPLFFAHFVYAYSEPAKEYNSRRYVINMAIRNTLFAIIISLALFFVTTPYAFIDWSRSNPCDIPIDILEFLGRNYFACDVGAQYDMARGTSGLPFTQQYIGSSPYWYQIKQLALFGLGLPLGVVAWISLLFTIYISIKYRDRGDILILVWVLPYFILTGHLHVKFLRYLLPISPILMIMVSRALFYMKDWFCDNHPHQKRLVDYVIIFLVMTTMFYAISYSNIYRSSHTAVLASDWIQENIPKESVLLKEHWEEQLPNLDGYRIGCGNEWDLDSCMRMYDDDGILYSNGEDKITRVASQLAGGDYLILFSNRLYGTVPRVPNKYPLSGNYYRKLFGGELGYILEHTEYNYPSFLGITLYDDTYAYPGLEVPHKAISDNPHGVVINLGYADESFTVYDHPKILIFKNQDRLNMEEIKRKLYFPYEQHYADKNLLLNQLDLSYQRTGGTWKEIFGVAWSKGYPAVFIWFLTIYLLGILMFPLSFVIFKPLSDRGYFLSKPLGLLIISYTVWMLSSLHILPFSKSSILFVMAIVVILSSIALYKKYREILAYMKNNIPVILTGEILFFSILLIFILIRYANPDLWHPFTGGEKPMEMAYINAIVKSTYMPPYDPWFAGGYINYYYFGFFMIANLIKLTGILPEIAFNLAVPYLAALTAVLTFSVVYNLSNGSHMINAKRDPPLLKSIIAGLIGVFLVCFMANMEGMVQLLQGFLRILQDQPFGSFDYWSSSRAMPQSDPNGYEITEFPFFTFIFADLHPHLISMPFTILSIGICLSVALSFSKRLGLMNRFILLLLLSLSIGSLRVINTWDFPTYLGIGLASICIGEWVRYRNESYQTMSLMILAQTIFLYLATTILFGPFIENYIPFIDGIILSQWQTPLYAYLGIHSLFVFIALSFIFINYNHRTQQPSYFQSILSGYRDSGLSARISLILTFGFSLAIITTLLIYGYSTVAFLLFPISLLSIIVIQWLKRGHVNVFGIFGLILVIVGMLLGLGVDVVTIKGDIARMNTVFKFYLQAWVLLGIGIAYILSNICFGYSIIGLKIGRITGIAIFRVWVSIVLIVVISSSVYMFAGTHDRLRDRFDTKETTLDGLDFMKYGEYRFDNGFGHDSLVWDYQAILWMRDNVEGSPVVLEGQGDLYRTLHSRVSIYTGLPTILGWDNHQSQQRGYGNVVQDRVKDISTIYSSNNWQESMGLMARYGVQYIYIGDIERHYYSETGLEKFKEQIGYDLELVYSNTGVDIYKVN